MVEKAKKLTVKDVYRFYLKSMEKYNKLFSLDNHNEYTAKGELHISYDVDTGKINGYRTSGVRNKSFKTGDFIQSAINKHNERPHSNGIDDFMSELVSYFNKELNITVAGKSEPEIEKRVEKYRFINVQGYDGFNKVVEVPFHRHIPLDYFTEDEVKEETENGSAIVNNASVEFTLIDEDEEIKDTSEYDYLRGMVTDDVVFMEAKKSFSGSDYDDFIELYKSRAYGKFLHRFRSVSTTRFNSNDRHSIKRDLDDIKDEFNSGVSLEELDDDNLNIESYTEIDD